MSIGKLIAQVRSEIPTVRSFTAEFVQMVGPLAEVNIGDSTVQISTVGYSPPIPGMTVRVEHRDGKYTVMGPAVPLPPKGTITGEGTPQAEVTADGVAYLLPYYSNYAPVLGDVVGIDWTKDNGVIQGDFTTVQAPTVPPSNATDNASAFTDLSIKANSSGRFQSRWWNTDPLASNSNVGIWVYGNRNRDALKNSSGLRAYIRLPALEKRGAMFVGTHTHGAIPGGAPTISNLVAVPLGDRSGLLRLPDSFAEFLRDNAGSGIGITSGSGYNLFKGTARDPLSGELIFSGSR